MIVWVLTLYTSDNDYDVWVYSDEDKAKKIIETNLNNIKGNDRYDIMEANDTRLTFIDQEDDVVVEWKLDRREIDTNN